MHIQSEHDFDRLARAAKLLAVAAAWTELGLWDELARRKEPVALKDLPGDPRALEICAPVLAHAGLLEGGRDRWMLSAQGRALAAQGALPTRQTFEWLSDLTQLPRMLRDGGAALDPEGRPRITSGGVRPDNREATKAFLEMLHRRSGGSADTSALWLTTRIAPGAHVLDLGGGHGRYAQAFVARGFRATLFDFPLVVDLARERHGDTIAYRAGNFHQDDLGGPYDAVFLSNIVHGESPAANASLMARVARALAPGGVVILKDMFIDEQGRDPENAVFFGLTMLFYTAAGRSYSIADVAQWCAAAGFEPPETVVAETFSLVFARRVGS
jgi:SAM-dependent methyltransferase